ncbi:MAG TPA: amidohydrolase family protein [Frankiaceae bacterium]|nr:amidohydrolase family protein [Frankiaceae bacterium]
MSALHLRGTALPDGQRVELWLVDGRVTYERPAAGAEVVTVAEGWILPGMVDAHCHIGLDAGGAIDEQTQERQALDERAAGVLLARDCGVPSDTRWIDDRTDLPRIIRAGRHVASPKRYIRNFGVEVQPELLVPTVIEQAQRGDGWVKIVGDWIDREVGDLAPCWPTEDLARAVAAAHEAGARVTTHVFGEDGVAQAAEVGMDCIEHATGLSGELVGVLAERQIAIVPTLINIANFPTIAAQADRFPAYARHMMRLHDGVEAMVAVAHEAGIPIYAGTDAGGALEHGRITDEIQALIAAGMPARDAIGAASWRARGWLGFGDPLAEGAPAEGVDVVILDADPFEQPAVLAHPQCVVLRGAVVA